MDIPQLRNHIPIAGPARREPVDGSETDMRVSIGFEPAWYHKRCGVEFTEHWHKDPYYRYKSLEIMKTELVNCFPSVLHWDLSQKDDLATISGIFGIYVIQCLYGVPLVYAKDLWPDIVPQKKPSFEELEQLDTDRLLQSHFVEELFSQMDIIASEWGKIHGYLNWQGILNNAFHLRGQDIFTDFTDRPDFVHQFFSTICDVMIRFAQMVQERQRMSGFYINQLSASNCVMNMISPDMYSEFVFPYDKKIASNFERFGVHTCNWDITPYIDALRRLPKLGYLDMGMNSDLVRVKEIFPKTRRAVLYSPMALLEKPLESIALDLRRISEDLAPCDVVIADIQHATPDWKINSLLEMCRSLEEDSPCLT
ncbi:MAG: uroporphyrinogen decarboxylase family protein [Desulfobacterales bacterium]|jgi:hypothetical protein